MVFTIYCSSFDEQMKRQELKLVQCVMKYDDNEEWSLQNQLCRKTRKPQYPRSNLSAETAHSDLLSLLLLTLVWLPTIHTHTTSINASTCTLFAYCTYVSLHNWHF